MEEFAVEFTKLLLIEAFMSLPSITRIGVMFGLAGSDIFNNN